MRTNFCIERIDGKKPACSFLDSYGNKEKCAYYEPEDEYASLSKCKYLSYSDNTLLNDCTCAEAISNIGLDRAMDDI